jgi:lysophospholipase L1-like esterase
VVRTGQISTLPGPWVGGTDCLHPNDAGHQKIAEAFAAVLAGADAQAAA